MRNGWRKARVEDICERVSVGIVIQPAQYYVPPEVGVRAFRSANVGLNRIVDRDWVYLSQQGHAANAKSALKVGDVLVVRSGAPGTACVVTEEYAGSNCIDLVFARPHQHLVVPEYLAEFTNSPVGQRHVLGRQGGLALKHFNVGAYKQLEVMLPPLAEQKAIVEILLTWDKAIEKLEALQDAKKQHLAEARFRLIHDPQCDRAHLRDHLSEFSRRNNGQAVKRVLSVTNSTGFALAEEQFAHRVASADLSNYKIVRRGQYAYNPSRINVGSIARLDLWDAGVLSPMYVVFEVRNSLDSNFFRHWLLSSEARQRIRLAAQGSVRETVGFRDLGTIVIPVPSLERQRKVSAVLDAEEEELQIITRQIDAVARQKRGLMQKLLTGEWLAKADIKDGIPA